MRIVVLASATTCMRFVYKERNQEEEPLVRAQSYLADVLAALGFEVLVDFAAAAEEEADPDAALTTPLPSPG